MILVRAMDILTALSEYQFLREKKKSLVRPEKKKKERERKCFKMFQ